MFEEANRCGLSFECKECSFCCTGSPGYVWLGHSDIIHLCEYLGTDFDSFVRKYCKYVDAENGKALSIREKAGYDCVFLDAGKCSVYSARPVQCRTYPFWEEILESGEAWAAEAAYCPGIGKGELVAPEKIAELVLERRSSPRRLFPQKGSEESP